MAIFIVTGSDGFVGGAVVRRLRRDGHIVVGLDVRTYAASPEQHDGLQDYAVAVEDVAKIDGIPEAVAKIKGTPRAVIHLAAESHVDRSIEGPRQVVYSNCCGTVGALDLARAVGAERFTLVSTDEVYGDTTGKRPSIEEDVLNPSSPYAASKCAQEHLVKSYARTWEMDVVITRGANTVGPWQHPEKFVPTVARSIAKGVEVPIYGDGGQRRQWISVEDHADGIVLATYGGRRGQAYNLPGEIMANLDVVEVVAQAVGAPAKKREVKDRPGHDRTYCCLGEAAYRDFGWQARKPAQQAIADAARWAIESRAWTEAKIEASREFFRRNYEHRSIV